MKDEWDEKAKLIHDTDEEFSNHEWHGCKAIKASIAEALREAVAAARAATFRDAADRVMNHMIYSGPGGHDTEPVQKILAAHLRDIANDLEKAAAARGAWKESK